MAEGLGNLESVKQRLGFDVKKHRRFAQSIAQSAPVPPTFKGRVPAKKLGGLPQELQQCDQGEGWHRCRMRRVWNRRTRATGRRWRGGLFDSSKDSFNLPVSGPLPVLAPGPVTLPRTVGGGIEEPQ